jgi:hypothetical protein
VTVFADNFDFHGEQFRLLGICSPNPKFDIYVHCMYNALYADDLYNWPFRIIINIKDHRPAHVHCVGPGIYVIIEIATEEVIRNKGVSQKDIKRLQSIIAQNSDVLMNEWRHYHEEE